TRQWVLKNDLTRGICDRVQAGLAFTPDAESHGIDIVEDSARGPLRIGAYPIRTDGSEERPAEVRTTDVFAPVDLPVTQVPWPDDISDAVIPKHVLHLDRTGSSAKGVVGPAHLPSFNRPGKGSRTVAEQKLVGSNRKLEGSVQPE